MDGFIELSNPTNPEALFMADFDGLDPIVIEKLSDAMSPGFEVEFMPEEAERAGAFDEDALSQEDAADSTGDAIEPPDNLLAIF